MKTLLFQSKLVKVFADMLQQWDARNEYCCDVVVEIDNSIGENARRSGPLPGKFPVLWAQTMAVSVLRSSTACWEPANAWHKVGDLAEVGY
jgi:hypothetical protein